MSQFKVGDRVRVNLKRLLEGGSAFNWQPEHIKNSVLTVRDVGGDTLSFEEAYNKNANCHPYYVERIFELAPMKTKEEITAELAGMEAQLAQLRKDVAAIPCAAPEEERWKPRLGDRYLTIIGTGSVEQWKWYNDILNEGHFKNFNCFPVEQEEEVKRKAEIERVSRKARYLRDKFGGLVLDGSESEVAFIICRDKITGEFKSLPQNIYGLIEFAFKERKNCEQFISAMGNDLNILYPPKP